MTSILIAQLDRSIPWMESLLDHTNITGGKRMRPALLLFSGLACGELGMAHHQVAAALEGRSSFDLLYRLSEPESDREIARVKTGIAFYNYESRKIARIPGDFRDAIAGLD